MNQNAMVVVSVQMFGQLNERSLLVLNIDDKGCPLSLILFL